MAEAVIVGAVVGDAVSKLSDVIVHVIKKSSQFRSTLTQIQGTITRIKPIFTEIEKLNKVLARPTEETNMFIEQLKAAEDLVRKCEHIKWINFYKTFRHSLKLDDLLRFFQLDVQLHEARDVKEVLTVVKEVQKRMEKVSLGSWSSGVPLLKGDVIGFDKELRDLKAMVLKDSAVDDCSVVVISAAGGCGKTTLVTKLCHDPQVQGKFGRNIYFATVSETPNLKFVVKKLLPNNQFDFTSDEDAVHRWGSFLGENKSDILLVLDDVWHESVVTHFKFKLRGYKILVTSRTTYTQFNTYRLRLLQHKDATNLFTHSAFSDYGSTRIDKPDDDIPDDLVDKLVKCCNNHPMTLSVIGGLLKGTPFNMWCLMLNKLSEGQQSVLDLDKAMRVSLVRSLDIFEEDSEIKQCYLDMGLFPEHTIIWPAALMDIWVHLYNHDEKGMNTLYILTELSSKNLATLFPVREDSSVVFNFCEQNGVMQHHMMRQLANYLSRQGPEEDRKRLIINNANGQDLPQLPRTVNARLLSISIDERFSMRWNDIQVPKVEVFVLNFISQNYELPQFMQNMESLKVLLITNYGLGFSLLQNFPAPNYLSGLTRIRLELVSISSSIGTSILGLVNLQKLSLIRCKIGNSFNECSMMPNKLPSLLEMEIAFCSDFVTYPATLCDLVRLKNLEINNCDMISLSEGFGNLVNLETLRVSYCLKLRDLPESVRSFKKLSIIDVSHCWLLERLPAHIGELGSLRTIHMMGCKRLHDLPSSVKDLCPLEVICNEEISLVWSQLSDVVKVHEVVEEGASSRGGTSSDDDSE